VLWQNLRDFCETPARWEKKEGPSVASGGGSLLTKDIALTSCQT